MTPQRGDVVDRGISRRPLPAASLRDFAPGNRVFGTQFPGVTSIPSVTQQPCWQSRWASETDVQVRVVDPMGPTATLPLRDWAMAAGTMVAEASRAPAAMKMNLVRVFMVYPRNDLATIAYYIVFVKI